MTTTSLRPIKIFSWVVALAVTTIVFLTIYATVQQSYRQAANDPQLQIAEDAVAIIASGADAGSLVPTQKVDISKSLDPFIIITDANGKVEASSAALGSTSQSPVPPLGALTSSKASGLNMITWQPRSDARSALVIKPINNGKEYVVVGRSLRIVEDREGKLSDMVAMAWLVSMALLLSLGLLGLLGWPLAWKRKPQV